MGSSSDTRIMMEAAEILDEFNVKHEDQIVSAHRTPSRLTEYAQHAEKIGIKKQDIIVDTLVLTIATNPENEKIILEAVNEIKGLGYKTILGVSNISHGLPNRSEINSKFFANDCAFSN